MAIGKGQKVVVAMSGGVDSSVAAALLKEDGYEVVGCFMRLGSEEDAPDVEACDTSTTPNPRAPKAHHQGCCSVNDAADARLVAAMLDVPFYVLNFRKDFGRVIDYFVDEYNRGRTPNPCVRCNDWLKFGRLVDYARSIDADFIASGHYARVRRVRHGDGSEETQLLRGRDHRKDQSYVLFGAKRDRLEHTLLPIGDMEKHEVRAVAESRGLPVFNKPDSQEICFVPDNDYAGLVRRRTPGKVAAGDIVDAAGAVVGRHDGHQNYTIGQRRGLGVSASLPLYVLGRNADANTVTVGGREDLFASALTADQTNWLVDPPTDAPRRCLAKIRYNSEPVPATAIALPGGRVEVRFDEPISAITPGQAVVCYDGDVVLGGGWIDRTLS
ncbi:MAG: tRNA 2-thiouridine(34) synthase MnmA [Planctomycetes bacterium]|nr:tRNA 2-thiouridine(34) synthase MnmA [Planctomycetota bacterium]